jgi:hypothetical protein
MRVGPNGVNSRARTVGRWLVRLAMGLAHYPLDLATTIVRAWCRFFFTPADPTPLGLIRIAVGLLLIWNFLTNGMDLWSNLSSDGWVDPEALRVFWREWKNGPTTWSLWLLVPDRFLPVAWGLSFLTLILFTLGLWSRATAVLSWVIIVSTVRRVPVIFFGFDQTILTWLMYLAVCGASGQALSVDRLLARRRFAPSAPSVPPPATVSANLGLRLIQLHLCLIYVASGLAKLQGSSWWNGEALMTVLLFPEYRTGDFSWVAAYPRLVNFLTHFSVGIEIVYPVLIWVRVLRPLMILGMVLLHFGIDQTLGLTEFSLAMIAGNLSFVSGRWLRGRSQAGG